MQVAERVGEEDEVAAAETKLREGGSEIRSNYQGDKQNEDGLSNPICPHVFLKPSSKMTNRLEVLVCG